MVGSDAAMRVKLRQMTGDREHQVVMVGRHDLDPGADRGPERAQLVDGSGIGPFGRGQDAPAVDEQFREARIRPRMLGARHRVRRHEMHAVRQVRCHVADHGSLHRSDVGDDRAWLQMRCDLLRHRSACADRDAEDHEVGVLDGLGIGLDDTVDDAEFGYPRPGFR
jgi:hypothetical protein